MRGVQLPGDRQCQLADFAEPHAGPGEVVVALRAAAVCGSDLHLYRASAAERAQQSSIIPGHEPAGVVVEVGSGVRHVKVGDRVSIYHYRGCGHCRRCAAGELMWCSERRGYGGAVHGSDADYLVTDERNCLPLADDLSFAVGALIACNTGTAYNAMVKLGPSGRDTVVISGLGPVGLNGLLIARAMGARVIGVDVSAGRRHLAEQHGADAALDPRDVDLVQAIRKLTNGEGAALAFETSGAPAAQRLIPELLAYGGKGAFVGFGAREPAINPAAGLIGKQLTLMGSFVSTLDQYWEIVRFIRQHQLASPLEALITHQFDLADAPEAFRVADSALSGKVMFVWS